MNARQMPRFQRLPHPQQAPRKSNLKAMIENMILSQQEQDDYIKQFAFKDVLSTHNKMLEA